MSSAWFSMRDIADFHLLGNTGAFSCLAKHNAELECFISGIEVLGDGEVPRACSASDGSLSPTTETFRCSRTVDLDNICKSKKVK